MVSGSRSLSESREDVISSWRFSNCSCCWTSSRRCSYKLTFYKYGTLSGLLSRALEMLSSSLAFSSRRVSTDERRVSNLRFFYHQAKENTNTSIYDWLGKIQYKVCVPTFSWIIISSSSISWITSFTIIVAMLHPAKIQFTNSLVLCYLLELLHVIYRFLEDSATDSKNTPASIALSIFCFFSSAERPLFLAMEYATEVKINLYKLNSPTTLWDLYEELNQVVNFLKACLLFFFADYGKKCDQPYRSNKIHHNCCVAARIICRTHTLCFQTRALCHTQ